jgi:hypothetical protein
VVAVAWLKPAVATDFTDASAFHARDARLRLP